MITSRVRWSAAVAAAGITAITGVGSTAAQAQPSTRSSALVIKVAEQNNAFTVSPSKTFQAGRVTIAFTAAKGDHTIQIVRLHKGYSMAKFRADAKNGIDQGANLSAIHRLDHRVTWLGGADSIGGKVATFSTMLTPGTYYAIDQDGGAHATLTVTGPIASRPAVPTSVTVTGNGNEQWVSPSTLPADGWVKLRNTANQPHFLVLQRVKESTTGADVTAYIKSGSERNPPWALKASTGSGVFSPHTATALHLQMPAGKYVIACFWPDEMTGQPHFAMGMWKLVTLS
ncbi:MAG TPA: hypothetical protein VHB69_15015 [Mycobacteriales bacterium]|nr:hypothetical protein [Mycobacteriales bacterium]